MVLDLCNKRYELAQAYLYFDTSILSHELLLQLLDLYPSPMVSVAKDEITTMEFQTIALNIQNFLTFSVI